MHIGPYYLSRYRYVKLHYFKSQSVCSFKCYTYGQFSCLICLHWYFHFPLGVISLGLLKRSLHDTRLTAADLEVRYKETRGNTVKQRNNVRKSYERTFGCTPQRPQPRLQSGLLCGTGRCSPWLVLQMLLGWTWSWWQVGWCVASGNHEHHQEIHGPIIHEQSISFFQEGQGETRLFQTANLCLLVGGQVPIFDYFQIFCINESVLSSLSTCHPILQRYCAIWALRTEW